MAFQLPITLPSLGASNNFYEIYRISGYPGSFEEWLEGLLSLSSVSFDAINFLNIYMKFFLFQQCKQCNCKS